MTIDRAISIRQPFVELILQGRKKEEYRSGPTNIRERVYLYASLQPFESRNEWGKVACEPGELPVGLILGSVEIVDCRPMPDGDGYAYVLRKAERIATPLRATNQPQPVFWRPQFELPGHTTASRSGESRVMGAAAQVSPRRRAATMLRPDRALAAAIGPEARSRAKLVKDVWAYIVAHGLQDQEERHVVNADATLQKLFGTQRVTLDEMAAHLTRHVS